MTVKTCVTCIYKSGSVCTKQWKNPPRFDLVTGRKLGGEHWMCSTQRVFSSDCGPKGRWWTPINPMREEQREHNIFQRAIISLLGVFR